MESKTTKAVNTKAEAKTAKTETKAVKPVETKTETAKEAAGSVKASVVNAELPQISIYIFQSFY